MKNFKKNFVAMLVLSLSLTAPALAIEEIVVENDNLLNMENSILHDMSTGMNDASTNGQDGKIFTGEIFSTQTLETLGNKSEIEMDLTKRCCFGGSFVGIANRNEANMINNAASVLQTGMNTASGNGGEEIKTISKTKEENESFASSTDKSFWGGSFQHSETFDNNKNSAMEKQLVNRVGAGHIETGIAETVTNIATVLNTNIIRITRQ